MEATTSDEQYDIKPEGWDNPPVLKDLKQNLTDSKTVSDDQKAKIRRWLDNLHIEGSAKVNVPKGNSAIQPKLIRKQAEWRYASLSEPFLATDDLFDLSPRTFEDVEAARQNALILNQQINCEIGKVEFFDQYVRATVDEGTAIVRVGWEFQEEEVEVPKARVTLRLNPQLMPLHQELAKMRQMNPTGFEHEVPEELRQANEAFMQSGMPYEPVVDGYDMVKETQITVNRPTLEVVDYRNVIIDPAAKGNMDRARFLAYSFPSSLSDLRKEGDRYTNLDKIKLNSTSSPLGDPDHDEDDESPLDVEDEARKQFVVREYWGFWDYDGSGIAKPFVAAWVGDIMIRLEENPYPDKKIPFVVVPFLPVKKSVYGEPDGELLIDNQKVTGALTRGMIDVMAKSANGQTGTMKGTLDATNKRKYQKGQDYEYNPGTHPDSAFYMHKFPEIPQSALILLQQQSNEAESMSGVKAFAQGINGEALGDSVGNGRGAMDAASKRETGILRRLAAGVIEIGRKIISMNSEFLEDTEIVRITNEEFVAIRRDDLAGKFDIKMNISTIEENDVKAQELAFMLQTLGNSVDFNITKMILRNIARLRKMPELAKEIERYEPQPDPMQEQIQQLEMQKLQMEIAKLRSEVGENQANAMLDQAKVGTEQAKARQLGSQADKTDLDFVEQESGVAQERAKELHGEQAQSNMALKQFEHNLNKQSERESELDQYLSGKKSEN